VAIHIDRNQASVGAWCSAIPTPDDPPGMYHEEYPPYDDLEQLCEITTRFMCMYATDPLV
jgi:hypothetical protein